jgi:arginase family enzyme
LSLIRIISADPRARACDIMELAPPLEEPHSDRTARLAAACLAELIASA